jgi:hypothetical protein
LTKSIPREANFLLWTANVSDTLLTHARFAGCINIKKGGSKEKEREKKEREREKKEENESKPTFSFGQRTFPTRSYARFAGCINIKKGGS